MSDRNEAPLVERVQSSFEQLSVAASNLNTASDALGKCVAELDAALKRLNVGVSAWVTIHGGENYYGDYWRHQVGYDKVGKQWGVALRTTSGNYSYEEDSSCEVWPFNDAPRRLRIEGVDKIPELLDKLATEANQTTKKIEDKTAHARQLADAIKAVAQMGVKK